MPKYLSRQGARGPNVIRLGHVLDGYLTRAGIELVRCPKHVAS